MTSRHISLSNYKDFVFLLRLCEAGKHLEYGDLKKAIWSDCV